MFVKINIMFLYFNSYRKSSSCYLRLNQVHGLSFSVNPGVPIPSSLINIDKELISDIPGMMMPNFN